MVVTFVSNYINHHQIPFCKEMAEYGPDVEFHFIQTMPMEQKRIDMGWAVDPGSYSFVSVYYEDKKTCEDLILNSDVTIFGWSEGIVKELEEKRLSSGKLSFRVSERIYREGQWKMISPKGLINKYKEHIRYRKKPVYLLCAGAYVASDFKLIGSYPGKMLKWGYFPVGASEVKTERKVGYPIKICWAGRLIDLKHPEFAVNLAEKLKGLGYDFRMDIIGDGELKKDLERSITEKGIEDKVTLTGGKKPEEVLDYMKAADIFIFTSNYLEGWGAVVNEAMSCGCAVVASNEAGAVPFLIEDGVNGYTYSNGDYFDFSNKVLLLFEDRDKILEFGEKAAETIGKLWNPKHAAAELIRFCKGYKDGKEPAFSAKGPMSAARIIKPAGFLRTMQEKNRLE
ncbi:glycosyltransferase family 4 protein [Butyrivibrio sp. INlla21]|uniref:glycosyltransferase family 4 protein n=1 Tax=Butyrivibrio sp. INlla21 TaxID=1520811 RepID=UPI0008DF4267|nr:glycosyltransferase family 4 protein [Butyrivibrio sp. INlla21]SFU67981.1 Glycosyltransferase involved in cell wall bisynthesis [Butyrivibrio sp. INlla21]